MYISYIVVEPLEQTTETLLLLCCEISGSHVGTYKDDSPLEYSAM